MNAVVPILGACLALALAAPLAAQTPATHPSQWTHPTTDISTVLLDHIQQSLKNVETVEADFIQQKNLTVLDHPLTIRGHFALQKPDQLIWIIREPVRYAIRIKGDEVRQWDEDTNRVDVIHLGGDPTFKAVSDQIQAWFLGDYDALAKSYDVDVLTEKPLLLGFTPKTDSMVAKFFKRVLVTFAKDEQYINTMVIDEVGGDSTTLEFIRTRVNQSIKQDVWRIPPNEP
jgi:outer membrane lipoprotein-sorting protein